MKKLLIIRYSSNVAIVSRDIYIQAETKEEAEKKFLNKPPDDFTGKIVFISENNNDVADMLLFEE